MQGVDTRGLRFLIIDAEGLVLGRLAAQISKVLQVRPVVNSTNLRSVCWIALTVLACVGASGQDEAKLLWGERPGGRVCGGER